MVEKHLGQLINAEGSAEERACRLHNLYLSLHDQPQARQAFGSLLESKYMYVYMHSPSLSRMLADFLQDRKTDPATARGFRAGPARS